MEACIAVGGSNGVKGLCEGVFRVAHRKQGWDVCPVYLPGERTGCCESGTFPVLSLRRLEQLGSKAQLPFTVGTSQCLGAGLML